MNGAGEILALVAQDVHAAVHVLQEAIGSDDLALVFAAVAVLQRAGRLADEAAAKLGRPRMEDTEAWLLSPAARRALGELRS